VSTRPDFLELIDDELRAFLHIAGVEFRPDPAGFLRPFLRVGGIDWILYLPRDGDMRTIEYWRRVVLYAYGEMPSDRRVQPLPIGGWIVPRD